MNRREREKEEGKEARGGIAKVNERKIEGNASGKRGK